MWTYIPGFGAGFSDAAAILWWLGAIVVAAAGLVVIGLAVRRRVMAGHQGSTTTAFTLEDLRQMHRDGHLSDEELERAKAAIIGQTPGAGADKQPHDTPPRRP